MFVVYYPTDGLVDHRWATIQPTDKLLLYPLAHRWATIPQTSYFYILTFQSSPNFND